MIKPEVNWEKCQSCDPCEAKLVCDLRAFIIIDPGEPAFIEPSLCNNCLNCLTACTFGAIQTAQFQSSSK